jgi:tetratricopeptide (TPR) repeat protein
VQPPPGYFCFYGGKERSVTMRSFLTRSFVFLLISASVAVVCGCSSTAVDQKVLEVKSDRPPLKTAVIKQQSSDNTLDPRAYDYYINGLLYEATGNLPKAAGSFKSALRYHPDSYELRYALAETYYRLRQYEQSIETLESIAPVDENVYLLRAVAYAELGLNDLARDAYLGLVRTDSNSSMAYSHLAGFYRQAGDIDSLIWAYENLVRTRPDNERIWRELGRLQAQKGEYQAARDSFLRSVEIRSDQTNILSYLGLAELYLIAEDDDSASVMFRAALEVDPYNVVANRELSALLVRRDSLQAALPHARSVAEATPLDRNAVRRLAVIYFGVDSLCRADSILTYLVASGERNSINHYYLGRIGILQEDYVKAIKEFTTLTQLADSLYESWLDLGFAYGKMDDFEHQIIVYQTGLNHMRDEASELKLLFAMGAAYEQYDRVEEAEKVFEEIIAKAPDYAQALNYLGYMLADRGRRLEYARDLIEKAVSLSPENAAYLDSYGWVYYRLEDFDKAVIYLRKAVALEADPVIFDHLGDAYNATGDIDSAKVWWYKALELQPANEDIKKKLDH